MLKHDADAIIRTLVYADIFKYALTEAQLWRFFIGPPTSFTRFRKALRYLLKSKKIQRRDNYYFLPKKTAYVNTRRVRRRVAQQKMQLAQKVANWIGFFPGVNYVGVSGALAMENAPKEDDIDLFIISAPHSLWITRLWSVFVVAILGLRRIPRSQKVTNTVCLNMFIDAAQLSLPTLEQDLYSAHEIVQLRSVINKGGTYEQFLAANNWVKNYLPHSYFATQKTKISLKNTPGILKAVNYLGEVLQLKYMESRRTSEKITSFLVRFHPQDARLIVLGSYREKLRKLGIKSTWSKMI